MQQPSLRNNILEQRKVFACCLIVQFDCQSKGSVAVRNIIEMFDTARPRDAER